MLTGLKQHGHCDHWTFSDEDHLLVLDVHCLMTSSSQKLKSEIKKRKEKLSEGDGDDCADKKGLFV